MLTNSHAFSGFAVKDLASTEQFYNEVLGLNVADNNGMGLTLKLAGGNDVFIYEKPNHTPAGFTILNFPVDDIDIAVDELVREGVSFERYDNLPAPQDERGILRGKPTGDGPNIAWFKDPSGNILSVLEN